MRHFRAIFLVFMISVAFQIVGCAGESLLYQRLQHEDPAVRLAAVAEAGKLKDSKAVPYLIDRLSDSEADVRFFAIIALDEITGRRMGYEYYGTSPERAEAIRRWREWLEKGRKQEPAESTGKDA